MIYLLDYALFEQRSKLIKIVQKQPYVVLFFDGVEKVHPQFWNTLLQILDDKYLTVSLFSCTKI